MKHTLHSIACLLSWIYLVSLPMQPPFIMGLTVIMVLGWVGFGLIGFIMKD